MKTQAGGLGMASSRYAARCVEGRAAAASGSRERRQPLALRRPLEEPPLRPPRCTSLLAAI